MFKAHKKKTIGAILLILIVWRLYPIATVFLLKIQFPNPTSLVPVNTALLPSAAQKTYVACHLGHPSPSHATQEFLFASLKPRKVKHGHAFHWQNLKSPDIQKLSRIFSDRRSYQPWGGRKMCGDFHGDYYFKWIENNEAYEAIVCFSCHEALLFHKGEKQRVDISSSLGNYASRLVRPREDRHTVDRDDLIGIWRCRFHDPERYANNSQVIFIQNKERRTDGSLRMAEYKIDIGSQTYCKIYDGLGTWSFQNGIYSEQLNGAEAIKSVSLFIRKRQSTRVTIASEQEDQATPWRIVISEEQPTTTFDYKHSSFTETVGE